MEKLIITKEGIKNDAMMPFAMEGFLKRIEKSQVDIINGNFKSQNELEKYLQIGKNGHHCY